MLVVSDLDDVFLPKPSDLLVNVVECRPALESMLGRLNDMFKDTYVQGSALGAGLQAAFKLVVRPATPRVLTNSERLTERLIASFSLPSVARSSP